MFFPSPVNFVEDYASTKTNVTSPREFTLCIITNLSGAYSSRSMVASLCAGRVPWQAHAILAVNRDESIELFV